MTRKQCFVFCHGFGFDSTFWNPLRPYFSDKEAIYLDLDYFDDPAVQSMTPDGFALHAKATLSAQSTDYIGIGHSLGLMKLMSLNIPFNGLIGLHGFVNFLGFSPFLHRRRMRELKHLTRQFMDSPELTLSQFYQRTGVAFKRPNSGGLNRRKLLDDLASLAHPVLVPDEVPMLVLGSNDDKITPPELLEDNFGLSRNVTIEILNQAQHGLGHFKPDVVYQQIMRFVTLG